MYTDKEIPAKFVDVISSKSTQGTVIIRSYDPKERNRRILKYGGGCFLGAVFGALIPLLHFILVPGFLIASVVMVVVNSRPEQIESCRAKCPQCGVDFVISKGKPQFPLEDICGSCHRQIYIEARR